MDRVTTVLFDFGGTLVEPLPPIEDMWREVAGRVNLGANFATILSAVRGADARFAGRLYDFHGRMSEYWRLYDGFVLDRLGRADPHGRIAMAIEQVFKEILLSNPFPETRDVLTTLSSTGYRLGIVSNATDDLRPRLNALGLAPFFDTVTYSQEARAEKPSPAIFQLAMRRLGCSPSEAVHVGDRPEADVAGARASGIAPILVDRRGTFIMENCLRVRDLREVPPLLERMSPNLL